MKISVQNLFGQIKNGGTGEPIYGVDTEPTKQNFQVPESNLASKIATNDEIAANIRRLNKKQHIVFDVLH